MVGPPIAAPTTSAKMSAKACVIGNLHDHNPIRRESLATPGQQGHRIEFMLENASEDHNVDSALGNLPQRIDARAVDAAAPVTLKPRISHSSQVR